jgi:AsmA protein
MIKRILLGAAVLIVVLAGGLFLWVRAVFTDDAVRTTLAEQLSRALGQPVTIGRLGSAIYPRVTVNLRDVAIGNPPTIHIQTLHVGTDLAALLSRRIEHARLELSGARIELPLPSFAVGSSPSSGSSIKPPVDIVSIDAIVLRGVDIVSGGRTLTGDVEVVPSGRALTLRKVALQADGSTISVAGRISDVSGPVGDLVVKAGALNVDRLVAFANDFAAGVSAGTTNAPRSTSTPNPGAGSAGAPPMNVAVALEADRATIGTLKLDRLTGKARITADRMTLEPITFGVFGGRYDGALIFTLGAVPEFAVNASVAGVDVAAATTFAASPGAMTGRLSGTLKLIGRGTASSSAMNAMRGTTRIDVANGTIRNLGLVRSAVIATSMRADTGSADRGTRDEPFTTLGATLGIAAGSATTNDLRLESKDLRLAASGSMRLDGTAINLSGQLQLSNELSQQAGRDLIRYTQEDGRVTLPVTITGSADAPHVGIDVASVGKRALTNRATEEAQKALKKGLRGLFKK